MKPNFYHSVSSSFRKTFSSFPAAKIGIILASFCTLSACLSPVKSLYPPANADIDSKLIYIMSHGWHTSVVFDNNEARYHLPALEGKFIAAKFLEAGWGDQDFYQAEEMNSGIALRAILLPTRSVLQVIALDNRPQTHYPDSKVFTIRVSKLGFQKVIKFINDSFSLDEAGRNIKLKTGPHGNYQYYHAKGLYYALSTCNNWTAKAVRASGFPITPLYAITSDNVFHQLESHRSESME